MEPIAKPVLGRIVARAPERALSPKILRLEAIDPIRPDSTRSAAIVHPLVKTTLSLHVR